MVRLLSASTGALLLSIASAHFTLDYPSTIGFDEDTESTGPCGGAKPDFSKNNVTDFHVGGDAIATNLLHPQGTWLYRGTLDQTANGGWVALFPQVLQSGLGQACQPMITAPGNWTGKKGLISAVVDAPDGILYQCAAVNFVEGMNMKVSACVNGSAQFSFQTDDKLTPLASGGSATSGGSSTSSPSSSSSSSPNAAPGPVGASIPVGGLLTAVVMGMMGAAYML